MVIVSGHVSVEPHSRAAYLAGCRPVVEQARRAPGCLDFAIGADLIDEGRINVFERWESQAAVDEFRGAGPGEDQQLALVSAAVSEYDISGVRVLTAETP
ncbi:quinol monooxygenase YgiN [Mycolicibacterium iranicum]|uniref:Quinol monooxygenase YgiN n=1 Tax=Mycolicibacterium iranicum TaxID=912594 RepID=A0A839QIY4_MYCIR|nr:antibiotic biosynthesis monooxygenase [Mycolicibacterium iranicum]MBB2992251.1 quinol monooxygenase YgiN [Mycolicibacterium iranicum]